MISWDFGAGAGAGALACSLLRLGHRIVGVMVRLCSGRESGWLALGGIDAGVGGGDCVRLKIISDYTG